MGQARQVDGKEAGKGGNPVTPQQLDRLANEASNARQEAIGLRHALDGANAAIARQIADIAALRAKVIEHEETIEALSTHQGSNT
jgi:hypothetical protein